jgi:hypothetical protein
METVNYGRNKFYKISPWIHCPETGLNPFFVFFFEGRTAEELKAFLCQSDWWDHSFTIRKSKS